MATEQDMDFVSESTLDILKDIDVNDIEHDTSTLKPVEEPQIGTFHSEDETKENEKTSNNEQNSDETQIILNLIESINKKPLNDKKHQIIEYIITIIGYNEMQNIERKEFMTNISNHCNEKKIKALSGKLYTKILNHQLTTNITHSIHTINNKELTENKDKIIDWFITQKIHLKDLKQMDKELFMDKVSKHCQDNNIKSNLSVLYKRILNIDDDIKDDHDTESISISDLFSRFIDEVNNKTLNDNKDNIIEWIALNQHLIHTMAGKTFMTLLSDHCNDKKVKGLSRKLWKKWETLPQDERERIKTEAIHENADDRVKIETEIASEPILENEDNVVKIEAEAASLAVHELEETKEHEEKYQEAYREHYDTDSSEDDGDSCYAEHDPDLYVEEQMPSYINRAIWFRSDDEHLERLVDKSIKNVLLSEQCKGLWNDPQFVTNLYDSQQFEENVKTIFKSNFALHFFDNFVEETFEREILLDMMQQEGKEAHSKDKDDHEMDKTHSAHTHSVYYQQNEYHIYSTDIDEDETKFEGDLNRRLSVDQTESMQHGFEWAVWKKKTKGPFAQITRENKQPTFGFWEILLSPQSIKGNEGGKNPGVTINHLNIIFELLRSYYRDKIERMQTQLLVTSNKNIRNQLNDDELSRVYCTSKYKPQKVQIDIFIEDGAAHYQLIWWNCRKRTECNAIAIRNMNANKPDIIKYYMRFNVNDLQYKEDKEKNKGIEWFWYDNDNAVYEPFSDYSQFDKPETQYKEGLLHKQIEATFQSNMDSNFAWDLFDIEDKHSFNHAQIPHLKLALGRATSPIGYLVRFTRLSYTMNKEKENKTNKEKRDSKRLSRGETLLTNPMSVHVILGMEQVAIDTQQRSIFPRNIKRLKEGKNSLKDQYSGSAPFIHDWLEKYHLSTQAQQKYFWALILCIATKIKQMDIEIEHQLVTIPTKPSLYLQKQKQTLFSSSSEVAQEQQDALLYKGFLVPPVLGEAVTDEISLKNASIDAVRESLEKLSKTRILQKSQVKEQGLINDDDEEFVYVHDVYDDQFLKREANMFRFAEIVRKFIIESKHLKNDTSLWPYYKNYSHKNDYSIYHTLVNRFNLSLMFGKHTIFKLFENEKDESIGCYNHICDDNTKKEDDYDIRFENNYNNIAIRHRRKYAATLLLEKWNTLRNLNLLRQQLIVIFNSLPKKQTQKEAVDVAKKYVWQEQIKKINKELRKTLKQQKSGWQFLSEYGNLKDNHPIEISIKQFPFFESFCWKFLIDIVKEERKEGGDLRENQWFREFKQSWSHTPHWWSPTHDLILLQLALKYNIDNFKYVHELKSEKAFDYRMRLTDRTTYLEFRHFCAQSANIMHRLKYITNIMVDEVLKIRPSLVDIRVPKKQKAEYDHTSESFIFSDYDKATHIKYVNRKLKEIEIYKPASKKLKLKTIGGKAEQEKYRQIMGPIVQDITLNIRKNWKIPQQEEKMETVMELTEFEPLLENEKEIEIEIEVIPLTQTTSGPLDEDDDESEDDEEISRPEPNEKEANKKGKKKKETVDPFIPRELETELSEVINAFDMIQYGSYMAQFVISQIKEFGMDELWTILGVVMEAIPFKMALGILYDHLDTLSRGSQEQMETLCLQMVNGTNWRISASLRMAEYFKEIADHDALKEAEWTNISTHFEDIAHDSINQIESDHLLYLLLTIPLYDTSSPMNIIMLALEQKRISFLNNERILSVINHIWYHGASIDIKQEVKSEELPFSDLLPMLFFSPFKFYITPFGYNYSLAILFLMYLMYVLGYSFLVVNRDDFSDQLIDVAEIILWILNLGYISYEFSEFVDKGREYFSVSGLMNVFDIMISVIWIALFIIKFGARALQDTDGDTLDAEAVILKVYTGLFGLQIFLLSTRFLTLFQNTEYLGGLLKIVQMMTKEILKFFSVAAVTIAAFTFGFFFIYGLEKIDVDNQESPTSFEETILFAFDLFIGGGTNDESVVGAVFTVFLTVAGMLILTNLLIALMTTEYEKFQETAQEEVHFMRIETTMDLAHRDRLMPPPLNVIVYPLGLVIHIVVVLFAVFSACCGCNCNVYARCNRGTYLCLDTCYCGCNTEMKRLLEKKRQVSNNADDRVIQRQLYNLPWLSLCKHLSCWSFCKKSCRKCCQCCKCCKQTQKRTKYKENPLTAYHKGCYNTIKLKIKDELGSKKDSNVNKIVIRGITTKEYIARYEQTHGVKLHLADTILLKHLTVDTLFCNYCYQPYLEQQVDYSLLPPFRVLLDVISCFVFLFTAWLPLVMLFILMAAIENLKGHFDTSVKSKQSDHGNQYEEFDREYFPHPEEQVASL